MGEYVYLIWAILVAGITAGFVTRKLLKKKLSDIDGFCGVHRNTGSGGRKDNIICSFDDKKES